MQSNQNGSQEAPSPEKIQEVLEKINKADEVSLLMSIICDKLGLDPRKTTHQELIKRFTNLMDEKLQCQQFMNQYFVVNQPTKIPKKRPRKDIEKEANLVLDEMMKSVGPDTEGYSLQ